jgi:4-amino-4-deoxy-L-arabinose transferase-like glycosyltransferase
MKPSRETAALLGWLAAGLLLRAAAADRLWSRFDRELPGAWETSASVLSQDGTQYVLQAGPPTWNARLFRDWDRKPYYRPPLASYYFAYLFPAVGFDRRAASCVQAALALCAYALVFLVARRAMPAAAAWCGLAAALLHPVLVYYDVSFEDSVLAMVLLAAAVALATRASGGLGAAAGAGTLLGLAVLARPNLAIAAAVLVVLATVRAREKRWAVAACLAAPLLLLTAAASAHNRSTSGRASFVTETSGENLYWGNAARPEHRITFQGFWAIREVDIGSPEHVLIEDLRERFGERSVDAAFGAAARDALLSRPLSAARGFAVKALRHLANEEIPRNENLAWLRERGLALFWPYPPYSLVFALASVGAVAVARRDPGTAVALATPWLAVFVTEVLYFNAGRYRALAIPFLLPLAMAGAAAAVAAVRRRDGRRLALGALGLGTAWVLGQGAVSEHERRLHLGVSEFKAAMVQVYAGDDGGVRILDADRFARHLAEALRHDPDSLEAFTMRQKWLLARGRATEAKGEIASRRARCAADDTVCRRTLDRLAERAEVRAASAPTPR